MIDINEMRQLAQEATPGPAEEATRIAIVHVAAEIGRKIE